jgi:type II secretory pathway pseudopilin PulG
MAISYVSSMWVPSRFSVRPRPKQSAPMAPLNGVLVAHAPRSHDLIARARRKNPKDAARQLRLLVGDAISSGVIGFAVTPFVMIIDKAVTEAASGAAESVIASVTESARALVSAPVKFVASPSFLIMWAAFGATYVAANGLDTLNADPLTSEAKWCQTHAPSFTPLSGRTHGCSTLLRSARLTPG